MLVACLLYLMYVSESCENKILTDIPESRYISCIKGIIKQYYSNEVTFVNMNSDKSQDILKVLHSMPLNVVYLKPKSVSVASKGYLIDAGQVSDFTENFAYLHIDNTWNPSTRFLIIIKPFGEDKLKDIFGVLLKYHVKNVLVLNGTNDPDLYTYNPFEDFACGKYYNRIINYGRCSDSTTNLYPEKLVTGLRNCTFNVAVPHWPPYGIDPSKVKNSLFSMGTEQYILHLISELLHFKINFTYNYDPEVFSLVSHDLSVHGPMSMLQNNISDIMLGGLILIPSRAITFSYIHGYLDFIEEITIMVKKASEAPVWKNFYLEFAPTVWFLLLMVLMLYSILVAALIRVEDKGYVILKLLDILLLHGSKIHYRLTVKCVLLLWIWFGYLVNCFYQSSLVSLTTKPIINYQIADEDSLIDHKLKPCISPVMHRFIISESASAFQSEPEACCESMLNCVKTISKSNDLFTIVLNSIYMYNKYEFYDKWGGATAYSFARPYSKVIYAIFMYKGFPMNAKLHELALRIRETGLAERSLNYQYYLHKIKYSFQKQEHKTRFVIPWYIFIVGSVLSLITFVLEILSKY